jgi:aryl-alcohol dehydrogenase-like predicted oxidoreductase
VMRYTLLGQSGLRVSELCLGTMTFGEDWGWGAPIDTSRRILELYAEAGGNFIDTANKYTNGSSESFLGELLQGQRDQFVLATKYTLQTRDGDPNAVGNHRKNLVQALDASLKRLRTDRIDVYWVHARDTLTPVDEVMRALDDQVRAGKILYVGVSDWPAWEIARANTLADLRGWSAFVGLEIEYSLLQRTPERDLLPMAHAFGLGVTCWSPLAGGLLTGKYLAADRGDEGRLAQTAHGKMGVREERVVRELVDVAEEIGAQPSQVALAWLLTRPGVVIPIIGASKEEQMKQNLGCLELALDDQHVRRLDEASSIELGFPHDFLRQENIKRIVYGDRYELVEDRRLVGRRAPADDLTAISGGRPNR